MYLSEQQEADIYPKRGEKVKCLYYKKCKVPCYHKKIHKFNFEFCEYLHSPKCKNKDYKCISLKKPKYSWEINYRQYNEDHDFGGEGSYQDFIDIVEYLLISSKKFHGAKCLGSQKITDLQIFIKEL